MLDLREALLHTALRVQSPATEALMQIFLNQGDQRRLEFIAITQ